MKLWAGLLCLMAFAAMAAEIDPAQSLAPGGTLRVAINYGNPVLAQRDPAGGPPKGVSADLARELARRLKLRLEYVPFDGAGFVPPAGQAGAWDICFLAIDPKRAVGIDFTAPYVVIEGAYLVPAASPLQSVDDVDGEGVRIMVDHGSAYDLFLQRALKHATLVYPPDGQRAGKYYLLQPVAVLAGVRQPLAEMARRDPQLRLMPGRFMEINQALGVIAGRYAGLAYARAFVEEMKASGFVGRSLAASGQSDAVVARAAP